MADTETNQKKSRPPLPKRTESTAYAGSPDEAELKDMHDAYDAAFDGWQEIKANADDDMTYVAGDPWTTDDRDMRKGRPVISIDQLGQYLNQLVNTVRQNKRTGKVTPEGNGANDETSRYLEGRMRQIEYLSHAQEAYTAAFENAAERSYGFVQVTTDYESPRSQNQRLCIKAIPNPDQCLPDADFQSTSGADLHDFWYTYSLSKEDFKRKFPGAKTQDFGLELQGAAPRWVQTDRVQIAQWWKCRNVVRTCLEIQPPTPLLEQVKARLLGREAPKPPTKVFISGVDKDKDKPQGAIVDRWERELPEVCCYLTNGIELLQEEGKEKKQVWKGKFIPFAICLGKVLYLTLGGMTKKVILSYIRAAKDSQKELNWVESTKMEVAAMQPRTPYMAYRGQLNADELALLQKSIHEPVAVVTAGSTSEEVGQAGPGQAALPLPRRELPDVSSIAGYEMMAEACKRNIQNALGRYSASVGRADTNVKSGVALKRLDDQSDQGSYHFIDHYDDMLKHVWEMCIDLLPYYDDTAKDVTLREPDDTVVSRRINDPNYVNPKTGQKDYLAIQAHYDHAVTISTGPSFDSEREAGNDLAMKLLENPQAFPLVAGDAVRLMNLGVIGDQMAEDLDTLQPPALQAKKAAKKGPMDPQALQMKTQQLGEQLQHAQQLLQQAAEEQKTEIAKVQAKGQVDAKIKQMDHANEVMLQRMKDATTIAVAKINAMSKGTIAANEAEVEAIALAHEAELQEMNQAHEAAMQAMNHGAAAEQGDLQRGHEVDQAAAAQQAQIDSAAASAQNTADA